MPRTDLYLKVVIDHEPEDTPQRLASEVCRRIEEVYGVRTAELQNHVTRPED
jgi:hypothetical protein